MISIRIPTVPARHEYEDREQDVQTVSREQSRYFSIAKVILQREKKANRYLFRRFMKMQILMWSLKSIFNPRISGWIPFTLSILFIRSPNLIKKFIVYPYVTFMFAISLETKNFISYESKHFSSTCQVSYSGVMLINSINWKLYYRKLVIRQTLFFIFSLKFSICVMFLC